MTDDGVAWESKRDLVQEIRTDRRSNNTTFVLVGFRNSPLDSIPVKDRNRYNHYFFINLGRPYFLISRDIQFITKIAVQEYNANTLSN